MAGWSEDQNATVAQYKLGATIKLSASSPNKTLYAVWQVPTTYKIIYDANGGRSNVPATQSASSVDSSYSFTVSGQGNLSKSNYRFAGWSENANATTVQYKPGSTIRLTSSSPEKTLYAIWAYSFTTNMQDFTPAHCSAYKDGESKQLIDTRDSKTYWVTKLADGNCWMTQNLDYDDPNSTRITNPASWTSTNSNYRAYYDPGEKIVSGKSLVAATSSANKHLLVGNYYSWESATNGTGSSTTVGQSASGSICPNGWKLPDARGSTANGTFGKLVFAYSGDSVYQTGSVHINNTFFKEPLYFVTGGYIDEGMEYNVGQAGEYWASYQGGRTEGTTATYLDVNDSYVNSFVGAERYRGQSVRCLVLGS